jgi:hypothetical protein
MTAPTIHRTTHPTYPATRAGVAAALGALGHDPDRVAATLANLGYLGEPGEARECPIAVYLHAVISPTWPVSVGEATAAVYRNTERLDVYLPDPVRAFIAAFDLGAYWLLLPAGYTDPEDR